MTMTFSISSRRKQLSQTGRSPQSLLVNLHCKNVLTLTTSLVTSSHFEWRRSSEIDRIGSAIAPVQQTGSLLAMLLPWKKKLIMLAGWASNPNHSEMVTSRTLFMRDYHPHVSSYFSFANGPCTCITVFQFVLHILSNILSSMNISHCLLFVTFQGRRPSSIALVSSFESGSFIMHPVTSKLERLKRK